MAKFKKGDIVVLHETADTNQSAYYCNGLYAVVVDPEPQSVTIGGLVEVELLDKNDVTKVPDHHKEHFSGPFIVQTHQALSSVFVGGALPPLPDGCIYGRKIEY